MNMLLTITRTCALVSPDSEIILNLNDKVEYIAHLPGGKILVRYEDHEYIMTPNATKELQ